MSCHYELEVGSHVFCEDLVAHAGEDKENILRSTSGSFLTPNILTRAVFELFGVGIKKSRKRKEGCSEVKKIFRNLKRKPFGNHDESVSQGSDWEKLCSNILEITSSADGDWHAVVNQNSISCLCFDDQLRFDGKRAVYVVIFKESKSDNAFETTMMCEHRQVSPELIKKVDIFSAGMSFVDKAKQYLSIFKNSPICHGFHLIGMGEKHINATDEEKHILSSNQIEEERWFLKNCEVITSNSHCKLCTCCEMAMRRTARKLNYKGKLTAEDTAKPSDSKFCNYRHMSREQLIDRIAVERKQANKEKTMRMALEEELIVMNEKDHHDLLQIMDQVEKKNVPQHMQLLWEQQEKIAKTKSNKGNRWHPR